MHETNQYSTYTDGRVHLVSFACDRWAVAMTTERKRKRRAREKGKRRTGWYVKVMRQPNRWRTGWKDGRRKRKRESPQRPKFVMIYRYVFEYARHSWHCQSLGFERWTHSQPPMGCQLPSGWRFCYLIHRSLINKIGLAILYAYVIFLTCQLFNFLDSHARNDTKQILARLHILLNDIAEEQKVSYSWTGRQ